MWDYLFDLNPNDPPRIKSLPVSSTIFTLEDQMLHRDPTLHCVRLRHALYEALQSVTPLHRVIAGTPIAKEHHCQISREPNISFIGAYCAFLRQWGGQTHCAFASLGDLHRRISPPHTRLSSGSSNITHTRLSSGHGSDTT